MSKLPIPFELDTHLRVRHPTAVKFIEDHWELFFSQIINTSFSCGQEANALENAEVFLKQKIRDFRKIAIFGSGVLGTAIARLCAALGRSITAFFDTYLALSQTSHEGYPLFPPDKLKEIEIDLLIISSLANGEKMKSVAAGMLLPGTEIYTVTPERRSAQSRLEFKEVIRHINDLTIDNPDKTLVFCCRSFNLNQIRVVSALKDKGFTIILITFSSLINGAIHISKIGSIFDYVYIPTNYKDYLNVLRNIGPTCIHYIGHMFHYCDAILAMLYCHSPFILEFSDIMSTAFDENSYASLRSPEEAEIEFWCEKFLCENADGIIYQDSEASMSFLKEKYSVNAPTIQFQSYVLRKNIPPLTEAMSRQEGPIRLVYAGGVHSNRDLKNDGYYLTRSLLEIAPALTAQGFQFDIYNCYDHSGQGFEEFYALARKEPLFNYYRPVLSEELPEILAQYDYAWYGLDFSKTIAFDQFYRECFGSKFWAYIEAGLPIIISKEHQYMTGLASKHGIGIPFCMSDLHDLMTLLARYDYGELKKNVCRAGIAFSLENQIDRLLEFYERDRLYGRAKKNIDLLLKMEESSISKRPQVDWTEIGFEEFLDKAGSFVLWPAGKITRKLLKDRTFRENHGTCRLFAVIDRDGEKLSNIQDVPVLLPHEILKIKPDSIVITSDTFAREILEEALQVKINCKIFRINQQGEFFAWKPSQRRKKYYCRGFDQ